MEPSKRAGPIGGERRPVYARNLKELDQVVTGPDEDRAQAVREWWKRISLEMYPGDGFDEAVNLLQSDHEICGFPIDLPDYPTAQIFLELFDAFLAEGDRVSAERFLDQAFQTLGENPRRSVVRRAEAAEARYLSTTDDGDKVLAAVRRSKGAIRQGHKKVLDALPAPKISVIVSKTRLSETRVKMYMAELKRVGWVHECKVAGMYAATGEGKRAVTEG